MRRCPFRTPPEWARAVLADPIRLLIDHAFLGKKPAANAMVLLTRWPSDGVEGWVETMTSVARDEAAHLAQVTRILISRGGRLDRGHTNPYARSLRLLVRKGDQDKILDRLLVSALIEVRSCERFAVLAAGRRPTSNLPPSTAGSSLSSALQGVSGAGAKDRSRRGRKALAGDACRRGPYSGGTGRGPRIHSGHLT
jgi:tRNA-(ms[2]io[6]A)-hydroxylase